MELFIEPLDKVFKSLHMCFLLSIIFDLSGFYGLYSLI